MMTLRDHALLGYPDAMNDYGCALLREGRDLRQGFFWVGRAAAVDNIAAMFNLGVCYIDGIGVEQNLKRGVEWYRRAAEHGDLDALKNFAYCLSRGIGIEQNEKEAEILWNLGEYGSKEN